MHFPSPCLLRRFAHWAISEQISQKRPLVNKRKRFKSTLNSNFGKGFETKATDQCARGDAVAALLALLSLSQRAPGVLLLPALDG